MIDPKYKSVRPRKIILNKLYHFMGECIDFTGPEVRRSIQRNVMFNFSNTNRDCIWGQITGRKI